MSSINRLAVSVLAWSAACIDQYADYFPGRSTFEIDLAPLLSSEAEICRPGSTCYANATTRWMQSWGVPHLDVIVRPTNRKDVEVAIQVANKHKKPFLAISGGHGATLTLPRLKHGIGIWLDAFKEVQVEGSAAHIGGGITSGELRDQLRLQGKQTVTGACDCTGAVAPMLGGGHGWLQGRYGLMADNLISGNLVLANGTSVNVSKASNPDLFWALRGAGHNFGIITDFKYRVYDVTEDDAQWSYEQLYYSLDRLEDALEAVNAMIGGVDSPGPVELIVFGYIGRFPGVSEGEVILVLYLIYQGKEIPAAYSEPLHAVGTMQIVHGTTDLPGVSVMIGFSNDSPPCQKNSPPLQRFPIALTTYPIPGMRAAARLLQSMPSEFNSSSIILEGYSVNAVQSVPERNTAYPDRPSNLLISPFITSPAHDAELAKRGSEYGQKMRQMMVDASGHNLNAYVNYAHGTETQQELYGHGWRLRKLQRLKQQWDPENRLGWYNPIEMPAVAGQ